MAISRVQSELPVFAPAPKAALHAVEPPRATADAPF